MRNNALKMCIGIICILLLKSNIYSQVIDGNDIWMGWATNEYNGMSYGAVANYDIDDEKLRVPGYGRYQFKYNTNLVDFLEYADKNYFKKWIEYGKGSEKLNKYEYGLPQAWTDYYVANKDEFINKQDVYLITNYYLPMKQYFMEAGFNIDYESDYIKGALLSILMFKYDNNEISQNISRGSVNDLINAYIPNDEDKCIENLYDIIISKNSTNELLVKRFTKEKEACIDKQDDEFDSNIGEILNKKGETNSASLLKEINSVNGTIFKEFIANDRFKSSQTLDWYDAVRTSVNYKEEFNISSGVLDFGVSTSRGINMNNYLSLIEDEVVFKIPDNGSYTYYIPHNTNKTTYSQMKFGSNNISQGGSSLACMSMALSRIRNRGEYNLILPHDIANKIIEKYNDVNQFYDETKLGQKNEIISAIADIYGVKANTISKNSVLSCISKGNMVIARVQKSEFTKNGAFILLCGIKNHNDKDYVIVADPNIYHTRFLYNIYDIEYIANTCKGIFFEVGVN